MTSFKRFLVLSLSSLAVLFGMLLPVAAFADSTYGYNCNWYDGNNSSYWNQYCNNNQGMLTVYVQLQNQYNIYPYRAPSDFTIYVSGANPSQRYFQGSQNGTTVRLNGSYSVSLYNETGYTPSYSSDCSGTLSWNDTRVCYVTLTSSYNNYNQYPPQYQPYYPSYQYQQPVAYITNYVPALPNTGFEPVGAVAIVWSVVLLIAAGLLSLPYVRKAFTALTR